MYKFGLMTLIVAGLSLGLCQSNPSCSCVDEGCLSRRCSNPNLNHIPENLNSNVTHLYFEQNKIKDIQKGSFSSYTNLKEIYITGLPYLRYVEAAAFNGIMSLEKLEISNCPSLTRIEGQFVHRRPGTYVISIVNCNLDRIPSFVTDGDLTKREINIDLSSNQIEKVPSHQLANLAISTLSLTDNLIEFVANDAFVNTSISTLKLNYNHKLKRISDNAFRGITRLKTLDISHTSIEILPDTGLETLSNLYAKQVATMKKLPPIYSFRSLRRAYLTYPYHCCLFKHAKLEPALWSGRFKYNLEDLKKAHCGSTSESILLTTPSTTQSIIPKHKREVPLVRNYKGLADNDYYGGFGDYDENEEVQPQNGANPFHGTFVSPGAVAATRIFVSCEDSELETNKRIENWYHTVICTPQPDDLNPCEDVMGNIWLRIVVWAVWILAIFGNSGVFVALIMTPKTRGLRVHNFLMANVAVADFFIGLYLGMLAVQDIRTAGIYYNHAVDWQTGPGCQAAGFICVFASELCIFCMMMMSFEMFYNTKFGIYSKRLTMKAACCSIVLGWLLSLTLAIMPLYGISSYSVTSTCLPLKTDDLSDRISGLKNVAEQSAYPWDNIYLYFVLVLNFVLFMSICALYVAIYVMVHDHDSPTAQAQDISLAKRMALLVSTDFLCWAPTIFFGLTTVAGQAFISISTAKILLVIFYPINSCTNPFIYVFLTKRFRKALSNHLWRYRCWRSYMERRKRNRNFSSSSMSRSLSTVMSKLSSSLAPRQNSLGEIANPRRSSGSSPRSSKASTRSGSSGPRSSEPVINFSAVPDRNLLIEPTNLRKEKDIVLGFRPKARDISECSHSTGYDSDVVQPLLTEQDKKDSNVSGRKLGMTTSPLVSNSEGIELSTYNDDLNLVNNNIAKSSNEDSEAITPYKQASSRTIANGSTIRAQADVSYDPVDTGMFQEDSDL